mmetsp:Transcript_7600/g.32130  ORF Transcript_7600/g.32130 Transcript_7600/m.32130 type:complete len:329 (-) Transcript_7600:113-1099(-)
MSEGSERSGKWLAAVALGAAGVGFLLVRLRLRKMRIDSRKADTPAVLYPRDEHKGTIVALHGPLQNGPYLGSLIETYHPELLQHFKVVCPSAPFRPVPGQLLPWTIRIVVWGLVQLGIVESRNGCLRQWYSEILQPGRSGNEFLLETYSSDVRPFSEDDLADAEQLNRNVARLLPIVEQEIMALGGDAKRLFLLGYSSGGMVALRLGLSCPQRLGGAVVLASFHALPSMAQGRPPDAFIHERNDRSLPIIAYAGGKDKLVPNELTTSSIRHLATECRCSNVQVDTLAEHSHRSILNHSNRFSKWLLQRIALLDHLNDERPHNGQLPIY